MREFKLRITSKHVHWRRFSIFVVVSCYDESGNVICHEKYSYDPNNEQTHAGSDAQSSQCTLRVAQASKLVLHLYILPSSFPTDKAIKLAPNFGADLLVSLDDEILLSEQIEIDQHGGYTIAGKEFSM